MKNIFIYLNIPWNFIKQRPQFLAEYLNKHINIFVYYNKPYKNIYTTKSKIETDINMISKVKIPRKNSTLRYLDNKIQNIFIKKYIKEYQYIWIMYLDQYEILKDNIQDKKIIYDCMDDYCQFPNIRNNEKLRMINLEKELVDRADYIFYSSETLRRVHNERYGNINNTNIVNNAFNEIKKINIDAKIKGYLENINNKKLVYIGAISEWFDFKLIENIIKENKDVSFILFGPSDVEIPQMERLYHFGKIEHDSIYTAMKYSDILIMPFKINDLILSVDPIKIYEYIYSGKPIIVPDYPEMDKFKGFVNTYKNTEEAIKLSRSLTKGNDEESVENFIRLNTWEVRAKQIVQIIENGEKKNTFN